MARYRARAAANEIRGRTLREHTLAAGKGRLPPPGLRRIFAPRGQSAPGGVRERFIPNSHSIHAQPHPGPCHPRSRIVALAGSGRRVDRCRAHGMEPGSKNRGSAPNFLHFQPPPGPGVPARRSAQVTDAGPTDPPCLWGGSPQEDRPRDRPRDTLPWPTLPSVAGRFSPKPPRVRRAGWVPPPPVLLQCETGAPPGAGLFF